MAANCWEVPAETEGFAGAMVIDVRVGLATMTVVLPLTDPYAAVIAAVP